MSSSYYDGHVFDVAAAQTELAEFKTLLASTTALAERAQVLSNFRRWSNLCAMFGTYHPTIRLANLIKRELTVGHHFVADLGVRKAGTDSVCLVEFEGAKANDIFSGRLNKRKVHPWGTALEKGYSQVLDWAWALDTYRDTPDFKDAFGSKRPVVMGVLVIGRSSSLSDHTRKDRWEWRSRWTAPTGLSGLQHCTYDDLYEYFAIQIAVEAGRTAPLSTATP